MPMQLMLVFETYTLLLSVTESNWGLQLTNNHCIMLFLSNIAYMSSILLKFNWKNIMKWFRWREKNVSFLDGVGVQQTELSHYQSLPNILKWSQMCIQIKIETTESCYQCHMSLQRKWISTLSKIINSVIIIFVSTSGSDNCNQSVNFMMK